MNPNPNPNRNANPFPWGIGWRAFFLGCLLDDRTKFENTMEVYSNFRSMEELHKESDVMVKKAAPEELKTLIPDPAKGAMSVDILRWAMNQAESGVAGQRAKWAKYRQYRRPHDHRAGVYFTMNTVPMQEEEEDAVAMIVRVSEPGNRSMPIEVDSSEEEETVVQEKTNSKATCCSNRLQGPRG